ncbi:polysaccharide deacetylase family protein [Pedobacter glucosidilyticus]|uniref:polysaccharide deacetylase family protein n=1 Tax=Pedobacter glucosidilyticus TaxID=1122941 RepID=UPI00040FE944|nr:polysaccharide deacetylase family protein [Pedobacter glucosidilyticus]
MSNYFIRFFLNLISFEVLKSLSSHKIILPLYHTVSDRRLPHIENLYKVKTIAEFRRDLDFFLRNYQSVDIKEIINSTKDGHKFSRPVFHLSFDDGLREVRTIIAPILLEQGIHATFFINPSFLDNKSLFYRFKVSLIIDALKRFDFSDSILNKIKSCLSPIDGSSVQRQLLNLNYNDTDVLDEIGGLLNVSFEEYLEKESPFLSIDDVHWLISKGFTIGAHSLDHPKYSDIALEEQIRQTNCSLEYLINQFDIENRLFAFPFSDNNVTLDYFNHKDLIQNYSFGTSGFKEDKIFSNFHRIPFEHYYLNAESIIKICHLKFLIRKLNNSNFVVR